MYANHLFNQKLKLKSMAQFVETIVFGATLAVNADLTICLMMKRRSEGKI